MTLLYTLGCRYLYVSCVLLQSIVKRGMGQWFASAVKKGSKMNDRHSRHQQMFNRSASRVDRPYCYIFCGQICVHRHCQQKNSGVVVLYFLTTVVVGAMRLTGPRLVLRTAATTSTDVLMPESLSLLLMSSLLGGAMAALAILSCSARIVSRFFMRARCEPPWRPRPCCS